MRVNEKNQLKNEVLKMNGQNNSKLTFNKFNKILKDLQDDYQSDRDNFDFHSQDFTYYDAKVEALNDLYVLVHDFCINNKYDIKKLHE